MEITLFFLIVEMHTGYEFENVNTLQYLIYFIEIVMLMYLLCIPTPTMHYFTNPH